jgi:hypothetical protein
MSLLMGIFSGISRTQVSSPCIIHSWGRDALRVLEEEKEHLPNEHLRVRGTFLYYISRYYSIRLFIRLMLKVDVAFHMLFFVPITVLHDPFALL